MDIKNIHTDKAKGVFRAIGLKLLVHRFYIISVAVLILLSVVILDVSVVTSIEADPSKIENEEGATTRQLEHSILEQIEERIGESNQSANVIPAQNPFEINN